MLWKHRAIFSAGKIAGLSRPDRWRRSSPDKTGLWCRLLDTWACYNWSRIEQWFLSITVNEQRSKDYILWHFLYFHIQVYCIYCMVACFLPARTWHSRNPKKSGRLGCRPWRRLGHQSHPISNNIYAVYITFFKLITISHNKSCVVKLLMNYGNEKEPKREQNSWERKRLGLESSHIGQTKRFNHLRIHSPKTPTEREAFNDNKKENWEVMRTWQASTPPLAS